MRGEFADGVPGQRPEVVRERDAVLLLQLGGELEQEQRLQFQAAAPSGMSSVSSMVTGSPVMASRAVLTKARISSCMCQLPLAYAAWRSSCCG
ncbi:hypothetical protein ACFQ3Z_04290 [Streptomyces nogalater]